MNKYRVEHGNVYEYDADYNAYLFIGKLYGRSLQEFLQECDLYD